MEQEEAERQYQKEQEERRRKAQEAKRKKRFLEAAFDGDNDELVAILKEVNIVTRHLSKGSYFRWREDMSGGLTSVVLTIVKLFPKYANSHTISNLALRVGRDNILIK